MPAQPQPAAMTLWSAPRRRTNAAADERRAALLYLLEPLEPRVLLSAGDLDPTFGSGGKVLAGLAASGFDHATSAVVLDSGKIVVAGRFIHVDGSGLGFSLARFNADGSLDTTFGDGGFTYLEQNTADQDFGQLALDDQGRILVATEVWAPAGHGDDFGLLRFTADGQLDTSFGDGGIVHTDVAGQDQVRTLTLRADGKIVVSGETRAHPGDNSGLTDGMIGVVIRYNPDGSLDSSFGGDGVVEVTPGAGMEWTLGLAVPTSDGAMLYAGNEMNVHSQTGHAILKLIADDGTISDLAFSSSPDAASRAVRDVKVDDHGRIVLLSTSNDGWGITRFLPDGTPDESFGTDGWVLFTGEHYLNWNATLRIADDDSILVAGEQSNEGSFTLTHYLADGTVDTAFGAGGTVTTDFNSGHDEDPRFITFTPDNKILVVGGNGDNHDLASKFLIARYDGDTWAANGEYTDGDDLDPLPEPQPRPQHEDQSPAGNTQEPAPSATDDDTDSDGNDNNDNGGTANTGGGGPSLKSTPFSTAPATADVFGNDNDLLDRAEDLVLN